MPSFLNPMLLWGLLIVAIPVLIHLINMLRQRRVKWAAMEFLLVSQKKNRTWVMLRELALLALRMLAVAAVVLMLAQPLMRSNLARFLGNTTSHHVVLLDDSFSMSDRWADTDAFQVGKQAVTKLGEQAAAQGISQSFTLLRLSQALPSAGTARPDLLAEVVTTAFPSRLNDLLRPMEATALAVGPETALSELDRLLGPVDGEQRIVYLVSDFRSRQWAEPDELKQTLARLSGEGTRIELVNCVEQARPNLAIASLKPLSGTRAAGVSLFHEVAVSNYGSEPAYDVSVLLEEDGSPRPAVLIDSIAAGKTETRKFPVRFPTAGEHVIVASLDSDAVLVDNRRYSVLDLPLTVRVLIVDGDPAGTDSQFLAWALSPGGPVQTGVTTQIEPLRFLDTADLSEFSVIYLTNIDRLDQTAISALESYVDSGGGVAFFCGDLTDPAFVNNQLFRDGEGFFPLPVIGSTELFVDRLQRGADLQVTDHPVFSVFAGERNSFLSAVTVQRYLATPETWSPPEVSTVSVLATLRNGEPLVVERTLGEGRVIAVLTTASPQWNNWGRNPSFVVALLEMQSYLSNGHRAALDRLVGEPLELKLDPATYGSHVRVTGPSQTNAVTEKIEATVAEDGLHAVYQDTLAAGVYTAELQQKDGQSEQTQFAFNVLSDEGNLTTLDAQQLASRLEGVDYAFHRAQDFQLSVSDSNDFQLSEALLYLLVAMLIGEQLLAYSLSYHSKPQEHAA